MDKKDIKISLKRALNEYMSGLGNDTTITEKQKPSRFKKPKRDNEQPSHRENNNNDKAGGSGKKDYSDVQRAFQKLGGQSMVDVMKMIGIQDDENGTNRSLFRKKVVQEKNKDTGSYYQFDDEELDKVRTALHIKN